MFMSSKSTDETALRVSLVGVPGNEIVPGAKVDRIVTKDGYSLRYAIWEADMKNTRGTVCLLQGYTEFIEKHFETVSDLLSQGYAVASLDWRGQGGSIRLTSNQKKGYIKSFQQYEDDLEAFVIQAVLPDCPPPYFALGHSMGANILIKAAMKRTWFDKVVLTAPLIDMANKKLPRGLIEFVTTFMIALGLGRVRIPGKVSAGFANCEFPDNPFTSDITRFERTKHIMEAAPDLVVRGATFGWLYAAFEAIASIAAIKTGTIFRAPVLIVASGRDRIVSTDATRNFAKRIPNVSMVVLDSARHEVLLEQDCLREQFWAAFRAFIHDQDPTVPL